MLSIQSFKERFSRYVIRIGQARLRRQLLLRDDRFLADTGFSRELLEQGIHTWPWRIDGTDQANSDVADTNTTMLSDREYRHAVAELRAYSDAELADLGIARNEIPYAVANGRNGIDQNREDLKHAA